MRIHWTCKKNQMQCRLKCQWLDCVYGLGLVGRGWCPGMWWYRSCPVFETEIRGMPKKYREIFIVDNIKNIGKNWFVANFGTETDDDTEYILTSNNMYCDEFACYSEGAKADAELVAKLLNLYHNNQIKL